MVFWNYIIGIWIKSINIKKWNVREWSKIKSTWNSIKKWLNREIVWWKSCNKLLIIKSTWWKRCSAQTFWRLTC